MTVKEYLQILKDQKFCGKGLIRLHNGKCIYFMLPIRDESLFRE